MLQFKILRFLSQLKCLNKVAGEYKPKVQVPRKSMGSHLTSQFSTMNTTRDKASSMKQISPSDSQVPNFDEYDTVKKK